MTKNTQPEQYDYKSHSRLAGKIVKLGRKGRKAYTVRYTQLSNKRDAIKTIVLASATIGVEAGFLGWLLFSMVEPIWNQDVTIGAAFIVLLLCIFTIESFRMISIISFAVSALMARNPVPVRPQSNKRIAFTTAIVPSKEPFEMVQRTLQAMKQVRYDGQLDVWLLDEGNDPAIKAACEAMGVHHFSRKGISEWNQPAGRYKAKTKHGNYNAWLVTEGVNYDYVMSVDSDHVPLPNYAERMLGYFRDRNVAFVVGPQVYANMDTVIARGAESQSYVFQATIQRAANTYDAAMFVGTNHAYRVKTILDIDGFQDSITEDLLTSLTIHGTRNPETGKFWKSVYTPDVLAVGEGPSSWTDFFSQQLRWSRGSNEILLKNFLGRFVRLPWRAKIHYGLIIWCYPAAALTWSVGIAVSMLYLFLGTTGVGLQDEVWLALFINVLASQTFLYGWLRRFNVSPHEGKKTFGMAGIMFSIFAAPVYAYSLYCTIARKQSGFVVTPKGDTASPDSWRTFKYHLMWAGLITWFLSYSLFIVHNSHPNVKIWCAIGLAASLAPVIMWQITSWPLTKATTRRRLLTITSLFRPIGKSTSKGAGI